MDETEAGTIGSVGAYGELAAMVAGGRSLVQLFRIAQRHIEARTGARNMFVAMVEDEDFLSFPYVADENMPFDSLALFPWKGLTGELLRAGRRFWISREPGLLERGSHIGPLASDWLGLPLRDREGGVLGALVVQSYDRGFRFDEEGAAFIEFVSLELALALQMKALDRELAVLRIADLVEDTTELDRLYRGIHGIVVGLVPAAARSFIIARIDRAAGLLRPVYSVDARERFTAGPWALGTGLSGYVVSGQGQAFAYEDGATRLPEGFEPLGERPAFWLGLPLRQGNEAIGVVIVQTYDREEALTREDERGLESLCPHIAHAITRTELFRTSRLSLP